VQTATLTAARGGGATSADWTALARDLSGSLVRPGDASYDVDKRLYDPRFDALCPAGIASQHAWLRSFWHPDLTKAGAWKKAYYGANYTRLTAVKKKYDPGQLFTFPQAV